MFRWDDDVRFVLDQWYLTETIVRFVLDHCYLTETIVRFVLDQCYLTETTGTRVHFVIFVIFIKIKYFPF
jgi:hypothetical protein